MSGLISPRRSRWFASLAAGALVLGAASLAVPMTTAADAATGGGRGLLPAPHGIAMPDVADDSGVGPRLLDVPDAGRHAFLLRLDTRSTGQVFAAARGRVAANASARAQLARVTAAQDSVVAALPARTSVLYRTHAAVAGVAVLANAANYARLSRIPGVAKIYPISPKSADDTYAVPLQGGPAAWQGRADLGADTTIAVIDTGVDFTHANFGGAGTTAAFDAEQVHADDATLWAGSAFPTAKLVDGFDLAGDAYNADGGAAAQIPHPDPNPLDCYGHGSHVAGIAAGQGVTSGGATYPGPYNASTDFGAMRIGPGMAPQAKLMAFRVFGCAGTTYLTSAGIDLALDPNGDGLTDDAVDVMNVSIGSNFGSSDDADTVVVDHAAALGVTMALSAGNAYDLYGIGGAPGTARRGIAVAASVDAQTIGDGLDVSFSGGGTPRFAAERSIAYDWDTEPDLAGVVVIPTDDTTGCGTFDAADAAAISGKIALLHWTTPSAPECGSVTRSANVDAAGGAGFILDIPEETFDGGITGSAAIPGVMVNGPAGSAIRAAIGGGQTVTVTGTVGNAAELLIPGDEDKVAGFSSRGVHGAGHLKPDVAAVGQTVFSTAVGTGNEGVAESGTSMAAPMVAGLSALVVSAHPDWTAEQVKADILNTAGQDLDTNGSATPGGERYAPNRVGTGRIQADQALVNDVLAYVDGEPGVVSVSFGPVEVTGPVTLSKTVTVENTGSSTREYDTSYDEITSVPGVEYDVSPPTVSLAAGESASVTVTLRIDDPSLLTKTVDPTHGTVDGSGFPLEFMADASGNLVLTPTSGSVPELRVAVYSAPRPASVMSQPAAVTLSGGAGTLTLDGQSVDQGTGVEHVTSLVTGLELQATSPLAPSCGGAVTFFCMTGPEDRGADLKYVGVTSDAPYYVAPSDGQVYFGIATHGAHTNAANNVEYDVAIDVDQDGVPEMVAYTTRVPNTDVFAVQLVEVSSGLPINAQPTNNRFGDVDTAIFDSDVMLMPVSLDALALFGVDPASPRIDYGVVTFAETYADSVGINRSDFKVDGSLSADVYDPGVLVAGDGVTGDAWGRNTPYGPLVEDRDHAHLDVFRDSSSYAADHGQGLLMLHFHNAVGNKAQVVELRTPVAPSATVGLAVSPTSVARGTDVGLAVSVTGSGGPLPTGAVSVKNTDTNTVVASGTLTNGAATLHYAPATVGTEHLVATYAGDGTYSAASSTPVLLTVTPAARAVTLTALPASVVRGDQVALTVGVAHGAGDPVPTGTVSVVDEGTGDTVASGALGAGGTATLSLTPTAPGTMQLHATYAGDASTVPTGPSPTVVVTVTRADADLRLTLPARKGRVGHEVTAEVAVETVLGIPATGEVVLKAGRRTLATATLVDGSATFAFTPNRPGKLRLRVGYGGDPTYSAGTSDTKRFTVKRR